MSEDRIERRLAAILAADIVGYSRLIEADEGATLATIRRLRAEVIDPLLKQHHGRIAKLMGDGAIIEFGSVVDAVACAVAVQRDVASHEVSAPADHRIVFRIGINLGDVVVEGEDLLGDGVNVAARLEQLCDPGGILVSGAAYDQLQGKLGLPLDFTGEQQVKNISRPVRTYRVRLDGSGRNLRLHARRFQKWMAPIAAALVLAIVGFGLWMRPWESWVEAASFDRIALPLPDKPSIAVLPFDNMSGDPAQGYFADGMTEDLITDLSKLSGIFVIARNSSWTYKDKPTKPQQVAEDLGVRYVLEGSVQRQGDQVRINAQLIDAIGGHHLWAERYDGSVSDVFALQDKVIGQIVSALAVNLTATEQADFDADETANPQAYDALLQGWDALRADNQSETLMAITLFQKATQLDPSYSRGYASLAAANWRVATSGWEAATGAEFEHAFERTRASLARAMQKPTSLAYAVQAEIFAREGRNDEALDQISKAMVLAPNDPENHVSRARILNATGHAAEAEKEVRLAMRMDPRFSPGYLRVLGVSLFHQERYEEALATFTRVVSQQSDVAEDYTTMVSCLGHIGRKEGVNILIDKYNLIAVPAGADPMTVQEQGWWWYGDTFNYDEVYRTRLLEGLRSAGVPEGAGTDVTLAAYKHLISKSQGEYDVDGAKEIDVATAKSMRDRGIVFVDVRGSSDFARAHIPGSVSLSLPANLSNERLAKVIRADEPVVFSCSGKYCPYSAYASAKALLWGYTNVFRFSGGFPAWKDAGYPVEVAPAQ